jgi:hypothetical protein
LTTIDGHGRSEWMPDEELNVEILDAARDEAQKLLLSMDPLAALAGKDDEAFAQLRATTEADNAILAAIWESLTDGKKANIAADRKR